MASIRANYFKIGLFVIAAFTLFTLAVVIFGANVIFRRKVIVETYFVESVQGLDVGSPVKFRGVQVGKVDEITLAGRYYLTEKRYVLVRMALFPDTFRVKSEAMTGSVLNKEIEKGLRVQLAFQGLTGAAYLETDYFRPDMHRPLEIDWTPQYPYIPSTKSTFTKISDSLDKLLSNLEEINIMGIADGLQRSMEALTAMADNANVKAIGQKGEALLSEMRESNRKISALLDDLKLEPMVSDATAAASKLRRILDDSEEPLARLLNASREASENISRVANKLGPVSGDLPESLALMRRTLSRLEDLIAGQQEDIEVTIENIRVISENLRIVSEDAQKYPAHILFGEAPSKSAGGAP